MIYVILDNIRSAFNVGSIFRSADGVGIDKLFLCGMTCFPPHNKLEKTALGTDKTVPWEYRKDTIELIQQLKKENIKIISAENLPQAVDVFELENLGNFDNSALIVGHELLGVGENILDLSDMIVKIPMKGTKTSLNVGVSAGILMYNLFYNVKK